MNSRESIVRITLLCLLLYAAASLASTGRDMRRAEAEQRALFTRLTKLQDENALMQHSLDMEISEQELAQLARDRLGLVMPGEKIFYFTTDREE